MTTTLRSGNDALLGNTVRVALDSPTKSTAWRSALARSMAAAICAACAFLFAFAPQAASAQTGTITIVKDAPASQGQGFVFTSNSPSIPTFAVQGRGTGPFSNSQDRRTFSLPAGLTYTITEAPVPGWIADTITCTGGSAAVDINARTVSVALGANQNVTCIFRSYRGPTGTITIVKDAPSGFQQGFGFTSNSPSIPTFGLQSRGVGPANNSQNRRSFGLPAGSTYTITEAAVPGWTLTHILCVGGSGGLNSNLAARSVTIPLKPDQNVVCTFRSSRDPTGAITIIADTQGSVPQSFGFTSNSPSVPTFVLQNGGFGPANSSRDRRTFGLSAGSTYTITQAAVPGWMVLRIDCTGGAPFLNAATRSVTIPLAANENVVCRFINRRSGTLTIVLDMVPNTGTDFRFSATNLPDFRLDDDTDAQLPNSRTFTVPAGERITIIREEGIALPIGFFTGSISCTGAPFTVSDNRMISVTVGQNQNAVCTFTNTN